MKSLELSTFQTYPDVVQAAKEAFAEKRRGELAEDVITHLADAITQLYES